LEENRETFARIIDLIPDRLELEAAQALLKQLPHDLGLSARKVYMPMRLALTGMGKGPELPYILAVMGGLEVKRRLRNVAEQATVHGA
jgi:nondiscriminating glutamyl-tRNA synthetase